MNGRTKCSFNWLKHKTKNTLGHLENFFTKNFPKLCRGIKCFCCFLPFSGCFQFELRKKKRLVDGESKTLSEYFPPEDRFCCKKRSRNVDWIETNSFTFRRENDDDDDVATTNNTSRQLTQDIISIPFALSLFLSLTLSFSRPLSYTHFLSPSLSRSLFLSFSLSHPLSQR